MPERAARGRALSRRTPRRGRGAATASSCHDGAAGRRQHVREVGVGVDQRQHPGRLAVGHHHRRHRQTRPRPLPSPAVQRRDRAAEAAAQPAYRVGARGPGTGARVWMVTRRAYGGRGARRRAQLPLGALNGPGAAASPMPPEVARADRGSTAARRAGPRRPRPRAGPRGCPDPRRARETTTAVRQRPRAAPTPARRGPTWRRTLSRQASTAATTSAATAGRQQRPASPGTRR